MVDFSRGFVLAAILLNLCFIHSASFKETITFDSTDVEPQRESEKNKDLSSRQLRGNNQNSFRQFMDLFNSNNLVLSSISNALQSLDKRMQTLEKPMVKLPKATTVITKECGGVVGVGKGDSVIEYLPPGGYKDLEFCVWTLLPLAGYGGLSLDYVSFGMENGYDGVTTYNWNQDGNVDTRQLEPSNFSSQISLRKPFAAIAFSSDNSITYGGFRVTIRGTGHLECKFNYQSFVLKQTAGNFSYPGVVGRWNYEPNERLAVVVQAPFGSYDQKTQVSVEFTDVQDDSLLVYKLERFYSGGTAQLVGRTSGPNPGTVPNLFSNVFNPRLILFHSNNNSNTGKGFSISWKQSEDIHLLPPNVSQIKYD